MEGGQPVGGHVISTSAIMVAALVVVVYVWSVHQALSKYSAAPVCMLLALDLTSLSSPRQFDPG